MGAPRRNWPPNEQIIADAKHYPTIRALADAYGVAESTFHEHLARQGIKEEVAAAIAGPPPEPKGDYVDLKIASLESEVRALRRKLAEMRSQAATGHDLVERIIKATREEVPVPVYDVPEQDDSLPKRSAIVPVFDQQYGQKVRRSDTPGGVGFFDADVFDVRLARWFDAVVNSLRDYAASHYLTELVIALGGDHVEGADIFKGQAWQLERDPVRQVVELTVKMADAIRRLIRLARGELGIPRVRIYAVPGNHGKVGGKRAGATPTTFSFDVLFQEWLRDKLRGEHIDEFVVEPGGALMFESADHVFLLIHGDEIKGHMGIPFYGITRFDGRMVRLMDALFDYVLLGHHHQPATIPNGGGEYIMSGDWVGANNLSRENPRMSRPVQNLLFVGSKYGITELVPIYLTRRDEQESPRVYR